MKLLVLFGCWVGLLSAFGDVACTYDQDKLAALEEQLAVQNNQLQLQNQELTVQKIQLTGLREQLMIQNKQFTGLTEQLTIKDKQLTGLNEQLTGLKGQLHLQNEEIEALKQTAMPRHEVEENQIAFSVASHDNFGPVTVDTNIPFPVVYTNVGDGWNPGTNAFLVFKTGFYLFTASFRGNSGGSNVYASIVHTTTSGNQRIASLFSSSGIFSGDFNAAIIQVAAGDFVSVQLRGGSGTIDSYTDAIYSTFSGHFLFP